MFELIPLVGLRLIIGTVDLVTYPVVQTALNVISTGFNAFMTIPFLLVYSAFINILQTFLP